MGKHQIIQGDCIEQMRSMTENSVDSIVTDPPYELGFMGKSWDSTGIAFNTEVWKEALRVLKPGGHLLAFSGSRTYHRMAVAIEDAGFEIRDQIMWIYGSGFPKSHNLKGDWQGWGTALKPAHEPIVVARKPLIGTVAANVLTYGTGGLNIDGTRVGNEVLGGGTMPDLRDVGAMSKEATGIDKLSFGQNSRPALRKSQPTYEGRWPANVIHDGSDEVVELFPETKGATSRTDTVSKGMFHGGNAGIVFDDGNNTSAARFFYCAKASKRDRNEGLDEARNHHPTVKPTDLMRYLCRLVTPPNGIVLDPFMGSGSTGKASIFEGFRFVGIEQNPEYVEIAKARIEFARNKVND
jgi:DNA modification methylase